MQDILEIGAGMAADSTATTMILGGKAATAGRTGHIGAHKTRGMMDPGKIVGIAATPTGGNPTAPQVRAGGTAMLMADPLTHGRPMRPAVWSALTVIIPAAKIAVRAPIVAGLEGPGERLANLAADLLAAVLHHHQRPERQRKQQNQQRQRTHLPQRGQFRQEPQIQKISGQKGGCGIPAKISKDGST